MSRILATDLQQSHCHFKSHIKSSLHNIIKFLPFLLNQPRLPSPELGPIFDNNSLFHWNVSLYSLGADPRKTPSCIVPYCFRRVTDPLPKNILPIVARVGSRGYLFADSSSNGSIRRNIILSRVRGSVTNNNGFWTGWLDLLTPSFIITLNYNQLQYLTINDCWWLAPFSFSCLSSLTASELNYRTERTQRRVQSYVTTDDQSASLSCNKAHI
jgi:hypothetical protein